MHFRNLLFAVAAAAMITVSIGLTGFGQNTTDEIRVTLPQPVRVGDVVLEPGEYQIRKENNPGSQVLSIFNNDQVRYEAVVLTIPTVEEKAAEDTTVVLHHIGPEYYFDKIWIEGKQYGYEFVLPERAKSLQRELALNVPATYRSTTSATTSTPAPPAQQNDARNENPASVAQSTPQTAPPAAPSSQNDRGQQEPSNPDRQDIAALQQDRNASAPGAAGVSGSQAGAQSSQSQVNTTQPAPQDRTELPATATNWLAFMLGGFFLLSLSLLVRALTSQE
jgi:hypothetical protein